MGDYRISWRRLLVYAAFGCIFGSFIGESRDLTQLAVLQTVYAAPIIVLAAWRWRCMPAHLRIALIVLLALPTIFFWRCGSTTQVLTPLSAYSGRQVLIQAAIVDVEPMTGGECKKISAQMRKLLFPEVKNLKGDLRIMQFTYSAVRRQALHPSRRHPENELPANEWQPGDLIEVSGRVASAGKNDARDQPWQKHIAEPTSDLLIVGWRDQGKIVGHKYSKEDNLVPADSDNATALENAPRNALEDISKDEWESVSYNGDVSKLNETIDKCIRFTDSTRRIIVDWHLANLGQDHGALMCSMVFGNHAIKLSPALVNTFRKVGLSHILAASGFNLTIVIAVTYFLARLVLPFERTVSALCFASMLAYFALAGMSASVLRACLMSGLLLFAKFHQRKICISSTLALGLIVTLIAYPPAIFDVGMQLSYAATAGIVFGADMFNLWVIRANSHFIRATLEAAVVVICAQLAVLPIQLYTFWMAGFYFLPANLLVLPVVSPITILGFFTSFLALFTALFSTICPATRIVPAFLCLFIKPVSDWVLQYMVFVANYLSTLPGAQIRLGQPTIASIVIYYSVLALFLLALHCKKFRFIALMFLLLALVGLIYKPPAPLLTLYSSGKLLVLLNAERNAAIIRRNENGTIDPLNWSQNDATKLSQDVQRFLAYNAAQTGNLLHRGFAALPDAAGCLRFLDAHNSCEVDILSNNSLPNNIRNAETASTAAQYRVLVCDLSITGSRSLPRSPPIPEGSPLSFAPRTSSARHPNLEQQMKLLDGIADRLGSELIILFGGQQMSSQLSPLLSNAHSTTMQNAPGIKIFTSANQTAITLTREQLHQVSRSSQYSGMCAR